MYCMYVVYVVYVVQSYLSTTVCHQSIAWSSWGLVGQSHDGIPKRLGLLRAQ